MVRLGTFGLILILAACGGSAPGTRPGDAALAEGTAGLGDASAALRDGSSPAEIGAGAQEAGPAADAGAAADHAVDGAASALLSPDSKLTLYVNLGDSVAAGSGASTAAWAYRRLLVANDDGAYPGFKGADLQTRFPALRSISAAKAGATSAALEGQLTGVPANTEGETLVTVAIGGNDFKNTGLAASGESIAETVITNLRQVVAHFADKSRYGRVHLLVFSVIDPTDDTGTIPLLAKVSGGWCQGFKAAGVVLGGQLIAKLQILNDTVAAYVSSVAHHLDLHGAFLGHAFHNDDKASPHYEATDPTRWLASDCLHPNDRGHHEIRQAIWRRLFGR